MIEIRDDLPLIPDEAARKMASEAARKLFNTAELCKCAEFGAQVHPRALDYIVQAPVLAVGIMAGGGKLNGGRANPHYTAHKFGQLCERGGRLREVMSAYGYPLPLRKIQSKALSLDDYGALIGLSKLNPSTLSQIIPNAIAKQRKLLSAIGDWRDRIRQYGRDPDCLAEWAYPQMAKHGVGAAAAVDMVDFAIRGDQKINPTWEWPRAEAACRDWHDRLSAGDAQKKYGVIADQIIDHGSHPDHAVVDGYEFIALRTPMAIHAEGAAMRHCVSSYVYSVLSGHCHIVSIQQDECRVATLEIQNMRVRQLKARFNRQPSDAITTAARSYVKSLRAA